MKRKRKEGYFREYYAKNKKRMRSYDLKRKFGITAEVYEQMLKDQNNACKICKSAHSDEQKLCVDHSHKTGKVRGLLCHQCNKALGLLKDDVALLEEAVAYLKV